MVKTSMRLSETANCTNVWTALIESNGHNKMDGCTIKHAVNCNAGSLY
jgi:hypothetical protein